MQPEPPEPGIYRQAPDLAAGLPATLLDHPVHLRRGDRQVADADADGLLHRAGDGGQGSGGHYTLGSAGARYVVLVLRREQQDLVTAATEDEVEIV